MVQLGVGIKWYWFQIDIGIGFVTYFCEWKQLSCFCLLGKVACGGGGLSCFSPKWTQLSCFTPPPKFLCPVCEPNSVALPQNELNSFALPLKWTNGRLLLEIWMARCWYSTILSSLFGNTFCVSFLFTGGRCFLLYFAHPTMSVSLSVGGRLKVSCCNSQGVSQLWKRGRFSPFCNTFCPSVWCASFLDFFSFLFCFVLFSFMCLSLAPGSLCPSGKRVSTNTKLSAERVCTKRDQKWLLNIQGQSSGVGTICDPTWPVVIGVCGVHCCRTFLIQHRIYWTQQSGPEQFGTCKASGEYDFQ